MLRESLPNQSDKLYRLLMAPLLNQTAISQSLVALLEHVLKLEFDELRTHLTSSKYHERCIPLLRHLSQALLQGDGHTADAVKDELHDCMPESELLAHFWRMLEAAAILVRGLWLQDAALSFQTGVLLGELGHGALARRIYMRMRTQLLGTSFRSYEQRGAK